MAAPYHTDFQQGKSLLHGTKNQRPAHTYSGKCGLLKAGAPYVALLWAEGNEPKDVKGHPFMPNHTCGEKAPQQPHSTMSIKSTKSTKSTEHIRFTLL